MGNLGLLLNPIDETRQSLTPTRVRSEDTQQQECLSETSISNPKESSSSLLSPCLLAMHRHHSSSPQARKKPKVSKDAAVFMRGTIRGECRFLPDEFRDELLSAQHQQFEIYPLGNIADYPRHIPYNSEKKTFLEKTGRECFEGDFSNSLEVEH